MPRATITAALAAVSTVSGGAWVDHNDIVPGGENVALNLATTLFAQRNGDLPTLWRTQLPAVEA